MDCDHDKARAGSPGLMGRLWRFGQIRVSSRPNGTAQPALPGTAVACTLVLLVLAGCAADEARRADSAEPTRVMAMADENQDGVVTMEEWDRRSDALFSQIDRSQDGQLDAQELRNGFDILDQDGNEVLDLREAPMAVEFADSDGDSRVTRAEFEAADWNANPSDLNDDRRIDRREFRQARQRTFRRFDDDKDRRLRANTIDESARFTLFRF